MANEFGFNVDNSNSASAVAPSNEFGWNSEFKYEEPKEFILLEPGEYNFEIKSFQRSMYNGGVAKDGRQIPACPMAKISIGIQTDDGEVTINDTFFVSESGHKRMSGFFNSIGKVQPGGMVKMSWWSEELVGLKGRAMIKTREYNGKKYNNVAYYLTK